MVFHSLTALIHMGGFAEFVWSAYGIVLVGLLANFLYCFWRLRGLSKKLNRSYVS